VLDLLDDCFLRIGSSWTVLFVFMHSDDPFLLMPCNIIAGYSVALGKRDECINESRRPLKTAL
jgi:hypothetical protein